MSKAVERRLRKIEKHTILRVGALPVLRPEELAHIDALMAALENACDPTVPLLPDPSDDHLSRAGKKRVKAYLSEQMRRVLEDEAENAE
jgi:hypothetical protein